MHKIGGGRFCVAALVATEISGVLLAGVLVAGLLVLLTTWFAATAARALVALG